MSGYPWDYGIEWRTERVSDDDVNWLALPVVYVADKVLRSKTDGYEDDYIERLIKAATELCEFETGESLTPGTMRLIASGCPCEYFKLQTAPVREVVSISYYDANNETQTYGGSPPSYVLTPGGRVGQATIHLGVGETWPTTATRPDAVTVEYTVGYEDPATIPAKLLHGIGLCVRDMYDNPDGDAAQKVNLQRFWPKRDFGIG